MKIVYYVSQLISLVVVRLVFPLMTHLKIEGRELIKDVHEPVIFIANHNSRLDPVYMSSFLPKQFYTKMMPFRYMTLGKTMRKLRSIPGLYILGCYAVEPGSGTLDEVLAKSMRILTKTNNALVMFPDSPLHKTEKPPFAKPGIAYLAKQSGRLVVPIGLSGTKKMGFKNFWLRKTHITMRFGKPFYYNDIADGNDELKDVAAKMMERVYSLLEA